jgi:hypothetical protein
MNTFPSMPVFQEEDFIAFNGRYWLGIQKVRSYLHLSHSYNLVAAHQHLLQPFVIYPDDLPGKASDGFYLDVFGAYLFAVLVDNERTERFTKALGSFIINSKQNRNKAMALRYELATLEDQIVRKKADLAAQQLRSKFAKQPGLCKAKVRRMEELSDVLNKEELSSLFGFPVQQITRMVNLLKQSERRLT